MNRRSFLSSVCGLFAAPFVAREVEAAPVVLLKPRQPGCSWVAKEYFVAADWARDAVPDRSAVTVVRVGPGLEREVAARFEAEGYRINLAAWRERMAEIERMGSAR